MIEFFQGLQLQNFMALGGPIIQVLFVVACVLWLMIIERLLFLYWDYPKQERASVASWQQRDDKKSWAAQRIRELIISQQQIKLQRFTSSIQVLIAVCPLLGLLGTVTGMVAVFDTIAITGNSDAKAMAAGIYKATLPTMAGLVLAITALYFNFSIQHKVKLNREKIADLLICR